MSDKICFSYLSDAPLGIGHRSAARRALRDHLRMPNGSPSGCFSYTPDVLLGIGNPNVAPQDMRHLPPTPGGGGEMGPCFSYQE